MNEQDNGDEPLSPTSPDVVPTPRLPPREPLKPFQDNLSHLRAELQRLQWMLRRGVLLARHHSELSGLVITDPEVDELIGRAELLDDWAGPDQRSTEAEARIRELRAGIDAELASSKLATGEFKLQSLSKEFGLSGPERDILLVALAPALGARYEKVFAYLQDDVQRRRPSANLALNLIVPEKPARDDNKATRERLDLRRCFAADARLMRHRLVELVGEAGERETPLLRQTLRVDESLVAYVAAQLATSNAGVLSKPEIRIDGLHLHPGTRDRLERLAGALRKRGATSSIVRFIGEDAAAVREAAEAVAATLDRRTLVIDLASLAAEPAIAARAVRDARLWDAALLVSGERRAGPEPPNARSSGDALWRAIEAARGPVFLLGGEGAFADSPPGLHYWSVRIDPPEFAQRKAAWMETLQHPSTEPIADKLAAAFRFGGARMRQTVELAHGFGELRPNPTLGITVDDLIDAGRELTAPQIVRFARRVPVQRGRDWRDIVLPSERRTQLEQIELRLQHRERVLGEWGFGAKLTRGTGLIALFTGPSGTGKTLAAEILASRLDLDLYQIDLSAVVSKYIGETEANLSAIFDAAERSQTLLFFDEADALFGKRTEVKDAHDRYANIEIDYLLQRVEQYEGVVVLATNLQRNLDEAFVRRIHEIVEFSPPDDSLRADIWRGHLPPSTKDDPRPWMGEIDYAFLARQFKLTGGNIRNITLSAAFLAASKKSPHLEMREVILATAAELRKEGQLCLQRDFGPYFPMLASAETDKAAAVR